MAYERAIYKYKMEATALFSNGEFKDISKNIKEVRIRNNYSNQSLPLYQINLMLDHKTNKLFIENDVEISLRIFSMIFEDFSGEEVDDFVGNLIVNTIIRSYHKPYSDVGIYVEDPEEKQEEEIKNIPFQIIGTPESLLDTNSITLNSVYEDVNVTEVILSLLSDVEIKNNIILDIPNNKRRYRNIVIPPMSLIPAIKFLHDEYGIYDNKLGVFLDENAFSIFKLGNPNKTFRNILEFNIVDHNSEDKRIGVNHIDENENIRIFNVQPHFNTIGKITDHVSGSNTVFTSYDSEFYPYNRFKDKEGATKKSRYFWNDSGDDIFEKIFLNVLNTTKTTTSLNIENIDPTIINVDTDVWLKGDGTASYSYGQYYILEKSTIFGTTNFETFTSNMVLALARIE